MARDLHTHAMAHDLHMQAVACDLHMQAVTHAFFPSCTLSHTIINLKIKVKKKGFKSRQVSDKGSQSPDFLNMAESCHFKATVSGLFMAPS